MKGLCEVLWCGFFVKVVSALNAIGVDYETFDIFGDELIC